MNLFGKKTEKLPTLPVVPRPSLPARFDVNLVYENNIYKVPLDVTATASLFSTHVYLATGVIPSRQHVVGFTNGHGEALQMAMPPDAVLRNLSVHYDTMLYLSQVHTFFPLISRLRKQKLMSKLQLPVGNEMDTEFIELRSDVERTMSKCTVLQEVDERTANGVEIGAKLRKLCAFYDDNGLKLLLKIDEIDGDDKAKSMRKTLVGRVNAILDRIEPLKRRLDPLAQMHEANLAAARSEAAGEAAVPIASGMQSPPPRVPCPH